MENRKIIFGWKPDLHDYRDYKFRITPPKVLPSFIDLRPLCPPVFNQLDLGSCTANALAAAYEFEKIRQKQQYFMPSRLFIYYNERVLEKRVKIDSGASLRNGIKTLNKQGVCPEDMWKYDVKKFTTKPNIKCYKTALKNQILEYVNLENSLGNIKQCLSDGYPVSFGFSVYTSFMSDSVAKTGVATLPKAGDSLEGGHAVLAVGFDDEKNAVLVRNSWGDEWGIQGYFYLPYEYISNYLAQDFWTIKLVE